jgi:hypothetical protein
MADHAAVAQAGDAVRAGDDLAEPVGDVDDAGAGLAQRRDGGQQAVGLGQGQAAGRLVEDDDARIHRQGTRDLDQLALRDGEIRHRRVRPEIGAQPLQQRRDAGARRGAVYQAQRAGPARLPAHQDVRLRRRVVEDDSSWWTKAMPWRPGLATGSAGGRGHAGQADAGPASGRTTPAEHLHQSVRFATRRSRHEAEDLAGE